MAERFDSEPLEQTFERRRGAQQPDARPRLDDNASAEPGPSEPLTERERRWTAFVTQAARVLASSLDFHTTVDNVLRLAVPQLADWCIASLVNDDNRVFAVTATHADPIRDELLHEVVARYRFEPGRPFLAAKTDASRPVVVPEVTDELLRAELDDEDVLRLVRALAPASLLAAPLVARDGAVGAVSLFRDAGRPSYDGHDLARFTTFAALAALAVDNCRLHRSTERELAERSRTQERLAGLLALNQSTLEATADGILVVDTGGVIVSYNHRFVEMWRLPTVAVASGYDELVLSLAVLELQNPKEFLRTVRELYATPLAESTDVLELKDGRVFERYSRPHFISGEVAGRVWSFRDVTERTRAARFQQLLAEASAILASSLDYTDTLRGVLQVALPLLGDWCRVDLLVEDGQLHPIAETYAGPVLTDPAPGAMPAQPIATDAIHPAAGALRDREIVVVAKLDDATRAALQSAGGELARVAPRSVLAVPMVARGRRIGAMTFGRLSPERSYTPAEMDTARELARRSAVAVENARLYEAALMANKAKNDFLAVTSHELRTPLTAIMGYTEILAEGLSGPITEEQRHQLDRIDVSARHLLRLIEQILAFASAEAGRERVDLETVDLRAIANEVVMLIHPTATKKGLQLIMTLPPELPLIRTDGGKLRQILINLLANAVKYTEGGTVGIAMHSETGGVRVRVWDTGIGIAAQYLERIFDPFWQVEQPQTRRVGGTGLGLSVTRHLARLLGGDVEVESRLGEGSSFAVYLPDLVGRSAVEHAGAEAVDASAG
jgi:signal transduction histidine kinase/PAS domain-containing protein